MPTHVDVRRALACTTAAVVAVACVAPPPRPLPPARAAAPLVALPEPAHDPDLARGALPSVEARRRELGVVRVSLDAMYAHRLAKMQRYQIDEDALFAQADARLAQATTWAGYDAAIYDTLVAFHDGHLAYHPPQTAAPARGYDAYRLGITTVLAGSALLVAAVDPGSDAARAGVAAGDEVSAIDGVAVRDVLDRAVRGRVWSRAESAQSDFARTWTAVLYPKGDPPRARRVTITARLGGRAREVAITPRAAPRDHRAAVAIASARSTTRSRARAPTARS